MADTRRTNGSLNAARYARVRRAAESLPFVERDDAADEQPRDRATPAPARLVVRSGRWTVTDTQPAPRAPGKE